MSAQPMLRKIQKYLRRIHNLLIRNKLSLLLEALSNCDNFTAITVLYNNDILTWDYKNNNEYQANQINQTFPMERSKYFYSRSAYHVRLTKIPSNVI